MNFPLYKTLFLSLPLILMSGCNINKKEETFHTVEYYVKNKVALEARIKECSNLKEITEAIEKDCNNANKAKRKMNISVKTTDKSSWF